MFSNFTLVEWMLGITVIAVLCAIFTSDPKDINTTYNRDGTRSLPEQQARDQRTCTLSGMDSKLNKDDEVVCTPKGGSKEDDSDCDTLFIMAVKEFVLRQEANMGAILGAFCGAWFGYTFDGFTSHSMTFDILVSVVCMGIIGGLMEFLLE